jgi:hypothetical protein
MIADEALIGLGPVERPALAHDQILVASASGWRCEMGKNHVLVLSAVARPAAVIRRRQPNTSRPLSDDIAALNARWDAAINGPDFDALLPMYSNDAELMPPWTRPVTGSAAIRSFFAARGMSVRDHHLQLASVVAFGK